MTPLRLGLSAFGPFAREVEVDFSPVKGAGLVLIEGPTGSGKTTLFDAMSFALFGKVPGARRDLESRLRCNLPSAEKTPTWVKFEFALGSRRYRVTRSPAFERKKLRGEGTTKAKAEASLVEITSEEEVVLESRLRKVTERVEELLGLDANRFKQVFVLPQGEFREFLLSGSAEKQALLERLFGTTGYERLEKVLKQEADTQRLHLERARGEQARLLAEAGAEDSASLVARTEGFRLGAEWLEARHRSLTNTRDKAVRQLADAESNANARIQLKSDEAALAELAETAPQQKARIARRRLADRVARLLPSLRRLDELRQRLTQVRAQEAESKEQLAEVNARLQGLQERDMGPLRLECAERSAALRNMSTLAEEELRLEAARQKLEDQLSQHERDVATLAGQDKTLASLEARKTKLGKRVGDGLDADRSLDKLTFAIERDERRLAEEQVELSRRTTERELRAQLGKAREELASAEEAERTAREQWRALRESREAGLAAELAAVLEEGEGCPVCGSEDHPSPAVAAEHGAARDQVEVAERVWDAASSRLVELRAETSALDRKLAEVVGVASQLLLDMKDEESVEERVAVLEARLLELRSQDKAARRVSDRAAKAKAELRMVIEEGSRLAEQADALRDVCTKRDGELTRARLELDAAKKRFASRLSGHTDTASLRVALTTALEKAEAEVTAHDAALTSAREAKVKALTQRDHHAKALGRAFGDMLREGVTLEEGMAAASVDSEQALREGAMSEDERQELGEAIAAYDRREAELTSAIARAREAMKTGGEVDVERLRTRLADVQGEAEGVRDRLERARLQAERLAGLGERVRALAAEADTAAEGLRLAEPLHRALRGSNPRGISLARYVLRAQMEEVTHAASVRLFEMSGGRYQLRLDDGASGRGGRGLDLVVEDAEADGQSRSVRTLSGGEMFMASLALALGLSDQVQAHSGGVHLDALFVDEGFGTLDDDALDRSLRTLTSLGDGSRLIGIISHLPQLRERISARVEVRPGKAGSSVRVRA